MAGASRKSKSEWPSLPQSPVSNQLILAESLVGNRLTSADGSQSGIVKSVKLTDDAAIAVLDDGTQLTVGSGITIE